ncbi:MAG: hypothetical protein ACXWXR_06205 [Candidatus Limnocylindrales bacterium]
MSDRQPIHVDDEGRLADEMARELEGVAEQSHVMPPSGFAERVMASIAAEPLPQPARAFGTAVASRRLGAALASLGDAWRVVIGGRVPMAVRAQAFALVLIVAAGSLAVAGGATVGAIDLLNANQPHPSPTAPQPSQPDASPSPSPSTSPSPAKPEPSTEPAPTQDAGETPESTDNPGGTGGNSTATPGPTRTEDHGGGSGGGTATPSPTGTDDHGGDGSGGGGETPSPTGSDDHGGGGDG